MANYGKELILDLHECSIEKFNRKGLTTFFKELCDLIKMEREALHFWDYEGVPENERPTEVHLVGTSAVQFIKTSNVVVHTLDILKQVYINIFSCKDFDGEIAANFIAEYFEGKIVHKEVFARV